MSLLNQFQKNLKNKLENPQMQILMASKPLKQFFRANLNYKNRLVYLLLIILSKLPIDEPITKLNNSLTWLSNGFHNVLK